MTSTTAPATAPPAITPAFEVFRADVVCMGVMELEGSVDGAVDAVEMTAAARQEVSAPLLIANDDDAALTHAPEACSTYSPAETFTLAQVQASALGLTRVAIVVLSVLRLLAIAVFAWEDARGTRMNWIRSGVPEYAHLSVADVHVSSVAGILDHAKLGTGVGRGKSELATVCGWDVMLTVARTDPGSERDTVLVLKTVRDIRVAIDDSIREYG